MKTQFDAQHLTRQLDLIPLDVLGEPITIIGAGAIGSWTALALAKMGFGNLTVWDDDTVSIENMNCQFYPMDAIGDAKAAALADMVDRFTGVKIQVRNERYAKGTFPGIVVAAVDSMECRKLIWENHAKSGYLTRAIIDPRMGAENALLYVMNPNDDADRRAYPKSLYSDADAMPERCTAKATIYTANMLAGLVCKAVKDLMTKPDYLRHAQWNIAGNAFEGHSKKVASGG